MTRQDPHPPAPPSPSAGRVASLAAKPRSNAREGGGAPRSLAQKLRANPSLSEVRMWRLLHSLRTDGYHFRKQVKLGSYYADFACLHAQLVIEVDGSTHGTDTARHNDELRDDYLRGRGFTVLRFFAGDVLDNGVGVGEAILAALVGKPRDHRGSPPPSLASLRRSAPSSTTLPAEGEGGASGTIAPHRTTSTPSAPQPTLPLAGRVAQLEAEPHSEAREGGETRSNLKEVDR
jgi:very-short-patch-repair endonuclease